MFPIEMLGAHSRSLSLLSELDVLVDPSRRPEIAMLLVIAVILSVCQLWLRYSMTLMLVVYGPMQLLRGVPYDIRAFIVSHSRIYLAVLNVVSRRPESGEAASSGSSLSYVGFSLKTSVAH